MIFAVASSDRGTETEQSMVQVLGVTVAATIRAALLNDLPLAFRGHLALGEGLLEDGLLLGEAVDVAAANCERADATCVWLCPAAHRVVESIDPGRRDGSWIGYDVPLVGRKRQPNEASCVRTLAVNPCGSTFVRAEHEKLIERVHRAFDMGESPDNPNVARKRELSANFLEECSRVAKEWWANRGFPDALNC